MKIEKFFRSLGIEPIYRIFYMTELPEHTISDMPNQEMEEYEYHFSSNDKRIL